MRRHSRISRGFAGIAAVFGLFAPGSPATAQLQLTPSLTVEERFSDNVDQEPDGEKTAAFQTDVTPAANLRWTGARVTTALDMAATARHQSAGDDEGIEVLPNVAGFGNAELSQDLLFLDAAAAARTALLNTREDDTEANRGIVQTYSASPYVVSTFGGFAATELRYRYDQVFNESGGGDDGAVGDGSTHTVSAALNSGTDFARILWSLNASASESERKNDTDVSRRNVALDLEYVVDRSFSVLAGGGYEEFDENDPINDFSGPTWNAGFRWRPGTRTELSATYGRRDDGEALEAALRYAIGPRTALRASYTDEVETGQERLQQALAFIDVDPDTGQLIDSRTGLPFDPDASLTSIDAETTRTKTFRLAVTGTRGRNTFAVSGTVERTEDFNAVGNATEENGYQIGVSWSRQLSPRASLSVFGDVERNEFEADGRTDDEINVGTSYSYRVFTNVSAFGQYNFTTQISDDERDEFTENQVTVGVRLSF